MSPTELWRHPFQVLRHTPHGREVISSHRFVITAVLWAYAGQRFNWDPDVRFDVRPTPEREDWR